MRDESMQLFLVGLVHGLATPETSFFSSDPAAERLKKACYFLIMRILQHPQPTPTSPLVRWDFVADFCHAYEKRRIGQALQRLPRQATDLLEASLSGLKKVIVDNLNSGTQGDLIVVEKYLHDVNPLIYAWPAAAALFLAGSDYIDALVAAFRIMTSSLRKHAVTNVYLCIKGLTEGSTPKYSQLIDALYSMLGATNEQNASTGNANNSLLSELVTSSPVLLLLHQRSEGITSSKIRMISALNDLAKHRNMIGAGLQLPQMRIRTKQEKGKSPATASPEERRRHLFSGMSYIDLAPHSTLPPNYQNAFSDDSIVTLAAETPKLHFGKQKSKRTADDVLRDRSQAPQKAAILSALAAFDFDDDERDDTYDAADVGGTVDSSTATGIDDLESAKDEALFAAYRTNPTVFDRDMATRRGEARTRLRDDTDMTDEAIEGWGLMLSRNPQQKRRLEARLSTFTGSQIELARTSWRAHDGEEDENKSDLDGTLPSRGGGSTGGRGSSRGGRGPVRGGGGRSGNVAGPPGEKETEQARRRKEASKSSRANHSRRDQRARKMARGGFPG
ncbi:cue domain containing protein [Grosmannia clavigera kw1407]|uniref:Cue domain containing protein n=1 Tax=Grosmannia clavigera (strain kw1407 / UAMH 11150) TaxID=655863 RepID=F0XG46_GROCL|nr:cue domain containing protein [Grosmannia clavigera kw1407]EFX03388.1 cue domain containing protein [Grosmannia clavigera kw1407]